MILGQFFIIKMLRSIISTALFVYSCLNRTKISTIIIANINTILKNKYEPGVTC